MRDHFVYLLYYTQKQDNLSQDCNYDLGSKNKKASVLFLYTCIYVNTGVLPQAAGHKQPWLSSKKAVNKATARR
jgi:hypothetical protein